MKNLQALCVARHRFLGDHIARLFRDARVDTESVVGLDDALVQARRVAPDVVVCEYDLLATVALDAWEHDTILRHVPMIAVSLTRHPNEMHPLDINGIAGFFYLPTLAPADAHKLLHAAVARPRYTPGGSSLLAGRKESIEFR